jgi:hypothetical protein
VFQRREAAARQTLSPGDRTDPGLASVRGPGLARASCFWVYAYPAFLRYAAHSAGGYWARILPQASEIAS